MLDLESEKSKTHLTEQDLQSTKLSLQQAHRMAEIEKAEFQRQIDIIQRERKEVEMHKGLADEKILALRGDLDATRSQVNQGDNGRVRMLMEERDALQSRIDNLQSELRASRHNLVGDTDRGRDDMLTFQRDRQRLVDEKAALAEKFAGSEGRNKQLQEELRTKHTQLNDAETTTAEVRQQLKAEMSKSHEIQLQKERMELLLDFEKKDMAKVIGDLERTRQECALAAQQIQQDCSGAQAALQVENKRLKVTLEKAMSKCKEAREVAKKEKKNAKAKGTMIEELEQRLSQLKDSKATIEASLRAKELAHKREIREISRRTEMGGLSGSVPQDSACADTAKSLREAFRKENAVLQELANMSARLSEQGLG